MAIASHRWKWLGWVRGLGLAAGLAVLVVLLMLYLSGWFGQKIQPGHAAPTAERSAAGLNLQPVRLVSIPVSESAVGTIRPVYETQVASKILAKVVELDLRAGQPVKKGQVLARLDDADLRARLQGAQAALTSAVAARDQAELELKRVTQLIQQRAATQMELERQTTALKTTQAQVQQAQQTVHETEAFLSYATVTAPMDGTVVDKRVNAGDMVTPGQVLLTLFDPTRMQLVASVRESLAHRLNPGQSIDVRIDAMAKTCTGQVSEIVPESEVSSRSFLVKVTGPCQPGMYTGMFGRLLIPLDQRQTLVIPVAAVQRVGQLDMVDVAESGVLHRRAVTLGRSLPDGVSVEVLSGLREGEQVVAPAAKEVASHG